MIANYGYTDAEGSFYITIDTCKCEGCVAKPCVAACPQRMFLVEEDPYGEEVAALAEFGRKRLRELCADCKPLGDNPPLPCVAACPFDAVTHSW